MRDGTRIAVDVCLPRGLSPSAKIPAIVRQTRYFRRYRVQPALRPFLGDVALDPMNAPMRNAFTARGYAWIDVDARGSGASFGERPCPWWMDGEVADGAEIVAWIIEQPWSNGRVGSTGVSYDGTTADFLATTQHPAVRAIAPRFALYDVYADVAFPGGLHSIYFTDAWESANVALDRNAPGEMIALIYALQARGMGDQRVTEPGTLPNRFADFVSNARTQRALQRALTWVLGGVAPVDADESLAALADAIASHAENFNVHHAAVHMTFRDDVAPNAPLAGQTSDAFSPHTYASRLRDAEAPPAVLGYGGWYDGGYANATLRRYRALASGPVENGLLIGPWIHGGLIDMDPDTPWREATFDHATELLRFFDRHLLPHDGAEPPAPVRFFMMGAREWRSSGQWPPKGTRDFALGFAEGRRLVSSTNQASERSGTDVHEVDPSTRAGLRSRWRTLLCPFMHADGKGCSPTGWLAYTSEPLEDDLEIVGHPIVVLALASSASDGAILAYLDDVNASGEARLLTEGLLRIVHRTRLVPSVDGPSRVEASYRRCDALSLAPGEMVTHAIELLPTAMRLRRRHRLRLRLAGADLDHFAAPTAPGLTWRIERSKSRLLLPVLGHGPHD